VSAGNKAGGTGVLLSEDQSAYTLSNGIVTARVDKKSGDLLSVRYKDLEMLATIMGPDGLPDTTVDKPGANTRGGGHRYTDHQYGFWSHDTDGPHTTASVTIDPKSNGGQRAEVAIKGISDGKPMGAGPGGSFIADIEIRYAIGRNESGLYTYSIFEHQPSYPSSVLGEARFCTKLADFFDWMSIGPKWNRPYPKAQGEHEDKYDFTADQFDSPAFGWSSTSKKVGFWFVNPSVEYLSGGPTKVEFLGHRDTNDVQAPTVLNYWRSSHYGGAVVDVDEGEHWTKVIGPFMLYVNNADTPQKMYDDAIGQAHKESQKWPYDWVSGVDYPHRDQRVQVSGRLAIHDPQLPNVKATKMLVGLSYPTYEIHPRATDGSGTTLARPTQTQTQAQAPAPPRTRRIDWQTDAKHYEFWARADANGHFLISNVRPGQYTLHAFGNGVMGEFTKQDIVIQPGKPLDMGTIEWVPDRRGKQVWDIGIPNRTGTEFFKGDDYSHDGMFLLYAKLFPNDINYTVGKSDFSKDWFFEQVPHNENPDAKPQGYNMRTPNGRATPWSVTFEIPKAPSTGTAHLRVAIASNSTSEIDVAVNDQPAGKIDQLYRDGAIARNGITGIWSEHDVPFDAALLKQGTNVLTLTVPAGPLTSGVIYDYLRLELDESGHR
jgi:rhamnogalacturonan endolyase